MRDRASRTRGPLVATVVHDSLWDESKESKAKNVRERNREGGGGQAQTQWWRTVATSLYPYIFLFWISPPVQLLHQFVLFHHENHFFCHQIRPNDARVDRPFTTM